MVVKKDGKWTSVSRLRSDDLGVIAFRPTTPDLIFRWRCESAHAVDLAPAQDVSAYAKGGSSLAYDGTLAVPLSGAISVSKDDIRITALVHTANGLAGRVVSRNLPPLWSDVRVYGYKNINDPGVAQVEELALEAVGKLTPNGSFAFRGMRPGTKLVAVNWVYADARICYGSSSFEISNTICECDIEERIFGQSTVQVLGDGTQTPMHVRIRQSAADIALGHTILTYLMLEAGRTYDCFYLQPGKISASATDRKSAETPIPGDDWGELHSVKPTGNNEYVIESARRTSPAGPSLDVVLRGIPRGSKSIVYAVYNTTKKSAEKTKGVRVDPSAGGEVRISLSGALGDELQFLAWSPDGYYALESCVIGREPSRAVDMQAGADLLIQGVQGRGRRIIGLLPESWSGETSVFAGAMESDGVLRLRGMPIGVPLRVVGLPGNVTVGRSGSVLSIDG